MGGGEATESHKYCVKTFVLKRLLSVASAPATRRLSLVALAHTVL